MSFWVVATCFGIFYFVCVAILLTIGIAEWKGEEYE